MIRCLFGVPGAGVKARLICIGLWFVLLCSSCLADEPLFDLEGVEYFESARFSFVQKILKQSPRRGPQGRGFMPEQGVVHIDFKSRRNGDFFEIVTESRQDGRLLFSTVAVIDRSGITERYVMYDDRGKSSYAYRYDASEKKGYFEYSHESGEPVKKTVAVSPDAYTIMTIPYIIGALTVQDNERHPMHVIVGDGKRLGLYLQRIDRETVTVGGRSYECSRIEMGFSGLIGLVVPKMMFWVDERALIPIRQDMMGGSIIEIDKINR